jgi:flavin-binding protein dodecin
LESLQKRSLSKMQLAIRLLVIIAVIGCLVSSTVGAASWPSSLNIAGFAVSDTIGTLDNDGSGTGTGRLKIPCGNEIQVALTRNSSGIVRASSNQTFTIGGISVDGSFELDGNGFRGNGTINTDGKAISNANYRLSPNGQLTGSGNVQIGNQSVSTSFNISSNKLSANGSASRQSTASTPLAMYTFKGELRIGSSGDSVSAVANGVVERRGKVGNSVDIFGPVSNSINTSSGQVSFNITGVNVSFKF